MAVGFASKLKSASCSEQPIQQYSPWIPLHNSTRRFGASTMKSECLGPLVLLALYLLLSTAAHSEEIFTGNPGKSLNFFHFDLAIERGFFKELGLDVKLLSTR